MLYKWAAVRMLQYPKPACDVCCHVTVRVSPKLGATTPAVACYCVLRRCSVQEASSLRTAPCSCIRRVPWDCHTALCPGKCSTTVIRVINFMEAVGPNAFSIPPSEGPIGYTLHPSAGHVSCVVILLYTWSFLAALSTILQH